MVEPPLNPDEAFREIIQTLLQMPSPSVKDLNRLKMKTAEKYQLHKIPSNSQIISQLTASEKLKLLPLLQRKKTRTISGVTVIAVMTKPYPCPQPDPCAYCPGGPQFGVPQSYTGFEPAAMRGLQNEFDPHRQVRSRIEQLEAIGHKVDKIELIVMGGTFPATPVDYQYWFVQRCLDAITGQETRDIEEAKKKAEHSTIRNVGITVETRPDWAKETHVDHMLRIGVTRVEMGVQNPSDTIYHLVGRTHTRQDVIDATRIIKDAGLKLVYHLMPGMPGSDFGKDLAAFAEVFSNADFKPDMVKIYPCLVVKGTKAYEWYQEGKYRPYTNEEAASLVAEMKKMIPPWVRVMRVQRDIPAPLIVAGVKRSNLRQMVQEKLQIEGQRCRCIRCREVGHRMVTDNVKPNMDNVKILRTPYEASEGQEAFISAEDQENDVLIGYLRLRIPSKRANRPELKSEPCSIVRELHVYGPLVPVGEHSNKAWQHKGLGALLLSEAERITKDDYGFKKILVISALGTKEYYMHLGYRYDGAYVSKALVG